MKDNPSTPAQDEWKKGGSMFTNRTDAAKQLLQKLGEFKNNPDVIVLAIPRGALPMSALIAHALNAPLDIILTKKISAPFNPEFAIGAATPESYFIDPAYKRAELEDYIEQEVANVQQLLKERAQTYRGKKKALTVKDKIVLLVDDGVATGRTMLAAIQALKQQVPPEQDYPEQAPPEQVTPEQAPPEQNNPELGPKKIIVAVPVISPDAKALLEQYANRVISVITPQGLGAIGQFYREFPQVSDEEAKRILQEYSLT